ncbi:uncharacterized protein BP5553_06819 [Venustampulla echinocandica]|uniref:Uncharacterized protein n=1 Tax=Venustampulla echinocandica TaxID=2656787 RepID=A0A370TL41_9HELO|nr:uncharacterized protein BP5553_06819 [Venustampulla echinocandica]RDL36207.1 hypothetical protein BP5553_06819 [Venustampulla echinocandica]
MALVSIVCVWMIAGLFNNYPVGYKLNPKVTTKIIARREALEKYSIPTMEQFEAELAEEEANDRVNLLKVRDIKRRFGIFKTQRAEMFREEDEAREQAGPWRCG